VVEKAKELNIKLHYLPPYSPNLNPIERLWKVMNEHARIPKRNQDAELNT
jgi:transposase